MSSRILNKHPALSTSVRRRIWFRIALWVFNLGAVLLSVCLALEVWQRWTIWSAESHNALIHQRRRRHYTLTDATHRSLWLDDKHYRPNASLTLDVDGEPLEVSMNNHGLRGDCIEVPKPDSTFRILCLGGSTTVEGPTNDTTYPALLQEHLRQHFATREIEVLNGGVSGYRAVDEPNRLEELLFFEPDLVIEYNGVNDLCWTIIPDYQAQAALWQKALRRSQYVALNCESLIRPSRPVREDIWDQRIFSNLRALRALCDRRGIEVMFCSFCCPDPADVTETQREYFEYDLRTYWYCPYTPFDEYCRLVGEYNTRLKAWCADENLIYVQLAETLDPGPEAFRDLCHMQADAIEAKAGAIAVHVIRFLESRPNWR